MTMTASLFPLPGTRGRVDRHRRSTARAPLPAPLVAAALVALLGRGRDAPLASAEEAAAAPPPPEFLAPVTGLLLPVSDPRRYGSDPVNALSYAPDGSLLAVATRHVLIYDGAADSSSPNPGEDFLLRNFEFEHGGGDLPTNGGVASAAWSPDGAWLVTSGKKDGLARLRPAADLAAAGGTSAVDLSVAPSDEVLGMRGGRAGAFFRPPDGDVLVADVEPRTYQAEDLSDLPAFATWAAPADGGWSALAAGGVTVPSPELVRGRDREYAAAFSPDGTRLAISGVADETRVVAYPGYATVAVLGEAEGRSLRDVAWSPDGGLIALATSITNRAHQGEVLVYETATWSVVATLRGLGRPGFYKDPAGSLAFSPDGATLVTGHSRIKDEYAEQNVHLHAYSTATWEEVGRQIVYLVQYEELYQVTFDPSSGGEAGAPRLAVAIGRLDSPGPMVQLYNLVLGEAEGEGGKEGGHGTASSHSVGTATTAENGEDGSTGGSSPATAPGPTPPALTGPTNSPPDDAGPPTDASPVNGGGSDAPEDGVVESGSDGADDPGIGPSSPAGSVFRVWRAEAFAVGLAIALLLV